MTIEYARSLSRADMHGMKLTDVVCRHCVILILCCALQQRRSILKLYITHHCRLVLVLRKWSLVWCVAPAPPTHTHNLLSNVHVATIMANTAAKGNCICCAVWVVLGLIVAVVLLAGSIHKLEANEQGVMYDRVEKKTLDRKTQGLYAGQLTALLSPHVLYS